MNINQHLTNLLNSSQYKLFFQNYITQDIFKVKSDIYSGKSFTRFDYRKLQKVICISIDEKKI